MKQLPSQPLTDEDTWIFGAVAHRHGALSGEFARALYGESMESDRRDADLMFRAQLFRRLLFSRVSLSFPNPWWLRYPEFELHWAPIGGELYVEQ